MTGPAAQTAGYSGITAGGAGFTGAAPVAATPSGGAAQTAGYSGITVGGAGFTGAAPLAATPTGGGESPRTTLSIGYDDVLEPPLLEERSEVDPLVVVDNPPLPPRQASPPTPQSPEAPPTPPPAAPPAVPQGATQGMPSTPYDDVLSSPGLRQDQQSPYQSALTVARLLIAPSRAPLVGVPVGGGAVTPTAPGGSSAISSLGPGALGAAAFLALFGGLAYVARRQGDTYEERVRRRAFGMRLLDEGLIDHEEFDEYVRTGNLPERAARQAAIWVLPERGWVDLWGVRTRGVTATGQPRDARTFWRLYLQQKGALGLSPENLERIRRGSSPIVDATWVRTYPEHSGFWDRRIEHHHVEGTSIAAPIPDLLHDRLTRALHPYLH